MWLLPPLDYGKDHEIPVESLEGFIRQMIGWREFIRAVYCMAGKKERASNVLKLTLAGTFLLLNASTGIEPIDTTIRRVLTTAYCHHIERLMVLGNIMLLAEFHPDRVYDWFSVLLIDAYDWVMVPNVYGMSQFADGGMISSQTLHLRVPVYSENGELSQGSVVRYVGCALLAFPLCPSGSV